MALSMPAAVFFMTSMAAVPARYRYKNGKTAAGYDQQDPDDQ